MDITTAEERHEILEQVANNLAEAVGLTATVWPWKKDDSEWLHGVVQLLTSTGHPVAEVGMLWVYDPQELDWLWKIACDGTPGVKDVFARDNGEFLQLTMQRMQANW